jgi:signal transduction histidine kinase
LLRNLIENGLHHGVAPVAVCLLRQPQRVEIVVTDQGPAIPADQAQHLFEPFYRPAGSKSGGTGLGLALVRQIAERHGGTARYTPTADGHNSFRVELPA